MSFTFQRGIFPLKSNKVGKDFNIYRSHNHEGQWPSVTMEFYACLFRMESNSIQWVLLSSEFNIATLFF